MKKPTSRVQPAGIGELGLAKRRGARRRVVSIATLAAAFSLFALYIAWLEVQQLDAVRNDESSLAAAVARAPERSGSANDTDLVKRGEYLSRVGDCIACHTSDKNRPLAGGVAINTPFGTLYSPNITPDSDTGIGQWSDSDFLRAMHEGIGRAGEQLYPAFPYLSYTKLAENDVLAIRAYLKTLAPVRYTPPRNELGFPFSQRWLMLVWNLFNFDEGRFVPDPKQSAEWNRGAYLVEGLAHCGECHTPRNFMQGLQSHARFAGAVRAGWHAFNITPDTISGIGNWSIDDTIDYLANGVAPDHAHAAGPMAKVVADSTQFLNREDLRSIAVYLRSLPPMRSGDTARRERHGAAALHDGAVDETVDAAVDGAKGAQLFIVDCATCRRPSPGNRGASTPDAYPAPLRDRVVGARILPASR
jgi:mono/diheme cytochrome c family protein